MIERLNRRIILVERPLGVPEPRHFRRADEPVAALRDQEFLVRNLYLSIDPAQRGWVQAGANYSNPVPIGGVMRSLAVGYDGAVNYRTRLDDDACAPHAREAWMCSSTVPPVSLPDAVLPLMNDRGRIVKCGTVAEPVWDAPPVGPRRDRAILVKRLRHEGFVIFDHVSRFSQVAARLAEWVRDGSLVYREDTEVRLARAPIALTELYRGINTGKKLIQLRA